MNNACQVKQFIIESSKLQCKPGVWCTLFDWLISPSKITCMASEEATDWMNRPWKCISDRAYVFDMNIVCGEELCPPLSECGVEYDLASTIFAIVGFVVFLAVVVGLGAILFYVMFVMPMKTPVPYVVYVRGKAEIVLKSFDDIQKENLRDKIV